MQVKNLQYKVYLMPIGKLVELTDDAIDNMTLTELMHLESVRSTLVSLQKTQLQAKLIQGYKGAFDAQGQPDTDSSPDPSVLPDVPSGQYL